MSDARIRRGSASRVSPRSNVAGKRAPSRSRALKKRSRLDQIVAMLPVSHATLQRMISWSIVGMVGSAAVLTASFLGLPEMARMEFASATAKAGFEVAKVEVHGVERMDVIWYDCPSLIVDTPNLPVDCLKAASYIVPAAPIGVADHLGGTLQILTDSSDGKIDGKVALAINRNPVYIHYNP